MSPESTPPSLPPAATTLPHSPAAERNAPHILQALLHWLPPQARVLEVASGTGQHAQHFAAAVPGWDWQPSEASAATLAALAQRCAGLPGVRPGLVLDVLAAWPVPAAAFDALYAANVLHIAPWPVTPAFMQGGLRSLQAVQTAAQAAGLELLERRAMPANNLLLRFVNGEASVDN